MPFFERAVGYGGACLLFLSGSRAIPHAASEHLALDLPVDVTEELDVAHRGLRAVVHQLREEARLRDTGEM